MQARNSHSKMPINGGDLKAGMDLILRGKKNYTLSAQRLISQYGDERIVGIQVCREPIKLSKIVEKLKLLRKKPYDTLFHLYMSVTLQSGKIIFLEKTEVLTITEGVRKFGDKLEQRDVAVSQEILLREMLDNAQKHMGESKYFSYGAFSNNCQSFIEALLFASRLSNPEILNFIKQDVDSILGKKQKKVVNSITGIAGAYKTFVD